MAEDNTAVTYTAEQVEQMKQEALNKYKSDSEAWVQKLITESKHKDKVLEAVGVVAWDKQKLIDIYKEDPKVWQEILDKYYEGKSIEEYKGSIGYETPQEEITDELIERKAKSIYEANKIKDVKKDFLDKVNLEWDELEAFNEEFTDRMQLRSFNIDKLEDNLIKAYKLATGHSDAEIRKINTLKNVAKSTNMKWGDKSATTEKTRREDEVRAFRKEHNM